MSAERSSSAVRNLRSLFENKASENSPDTRGRSPGLLGRSETENNASPLPPRSRIRASFVAVEPRFDMATTAAEGLSTPPADNVTNATQTTTSELHRESSKGLRRASFSDNKDGLAAGALRETIFTEQARRDEDSSVGETIPESAIESAAPTPLVEVDQQLGTSQTDKPARNPDKPVTGAEEDPAAIKPADPASAEAVSGGKALAPGVEDLRKPDTKKAPGRTPANTRPTANGKLSTIATKDAPKTSSSSIKPPVSQPVSQPKTPLSPPAESSPNSASQVAKKPTRASLTAPTAASVARAAAVDKTAAGSKHAAPKPKPREVTKPLDVSSRLTAPTAASRAKYEPATAAPAIPKPTSTRPKTATSRPTPRQSLARPESRGSQTSTRRPAGPVDSSFLERMTRPTAASSNKTQKIQDKVEVKSPPRPSKQIPHHPKPNGHPKGVKTASKVAAEEPAGDTTAIEEPSILPEEEADQTLLEEEPVVQDVVAGAPVEAASGAEPEVVATEATPAAEQAPEKLVGPLGRVNALPPTNGHTNGETNGHNEESNAAPAPEKVSAPKTADNTLS